ncbi:helix-turn-helix domain-containing protein [Brevibacillus sp. Leaf182]|uniref:helix-turn-helix domain-containing protein n=1 Tax=Brevibacillus sp. Leaf182 TaxID=1736290 RepID=UPI0009EBC522|nr:transcriptional regulator [Brevibacillus sp. Leaf182]
MEFGKYIKQLRDIRGLSVRELSRRSGVSVAHISQLESGQRGIPKPDTIKKLADGLSCDYDEIMKIAGYGIESKPNNSTSSSSLNNKQLSDIENLFFYELDKLSEEDKQKALEHVRYLRYLAEQQK